MMLNSHFILDENKKPKKVADFIEWAKWYGNIENRRVDETEQRKIRVSTVFLGINHRFTKPDEGPPILFETMVFLDGAASEAFRCCTWDEAVKQHEMACEQYFNPNNYGQHLKNRKKTKGTGEESSKT